jgi:hypothetical protein
MKGARSMARCIRKQMRVGGTVKTKLSYDRDLLACLAIFRP